MKRKYSRKPGKVVVRHISEYPPEEQERMRALRFKGRTMNLIVDEEDDDWRLGNGR